MPLFPGKWKSPVTSPGFSSHKGGVKPPFSLLILFLLFSTFSSARDPWVTQTSLTAAQLESRLATFSAPALGLVPEQITGYEEAGAIRYAALWGPRADAYPRQILLGLTSTQLTLQNLPLQNSGWRLHWLDGFHSGGTDYYNAIYRRTHGPAQSIRLGQTLAQHNTSRAELTAAGHYLENLTVFRSTGLNLRYAAFWNQFTGFAPQIEVSYGITSFDLNTQIALRSANWRIHSLHGYEPPSIGATPEPRYTVVWRRPALTGSWNVLHGMEKLNYFAADSNHTGIGWRPAYLQAWKHGNDMKFNALWLPNGGLAQSRIDSIDTLVNNFLADNSIPALSLAISRGGRLVFKRAWGLADPENDEWAGPEHRFRFASVAKPITGAAVVHALENQTARTLDSPLFGSGSIFRNTYGTQPYSANERAITIRHLLHHTHGWDSEGRLWWNNWPAYGSDPNPVIDWQLDNIDVTSTPGTYGRYSNFGYVVAARVVERLSGKTYETYVHDHLFTPSGVTGLLRPRIGGRTRAERHPMEVTYDRGPDSGDPYEIDHHRMDGSTGWIARPSDLLLLGRRVDGNATHTDILSADSITALRTPGAPDSSTGYIWQTYGLGWAPSHAPWGDIVDWGHNGGMSGTRSEFHVSMNSGTSFAWVANRRTYGDPDPANAFTANLRGIFSNITAANAWPRFDLFGVWHPEYNAWVAEHFTATERGLPGLEHLLTDPAADPDGDGLPNAAEYYHGLDPRQPDASPYHTAIVGNNLRIRWLRKTGLEGATIACRFSTNLTSWVSLASVTIKDRPELIAPLGSSWQELVIPISGPHRFVRFHFDTH